MIVQVISNWITETDGTIVPYFAPLRDGEFWEDITAQSAPPQTPNSVVLNCVVGTDTFADIESDSNLHIVWDNPNPQPADGTPSAAEWARLNDFLASQGYTPQERRDAIGLTPNGRSRLEVGNDLIGWLRGR